MIVDPDRARALAEAVLVKHGAPREHAVLQTDLLLEAELRGVASHGLLRLRRIVERIQNGVTNPRATGVHEWVSRAFLRVDGERGLGPVVALAALHAVQTRAAQDGVAIVAIRNNNHLGMLAWYGEQVAAKGFIVLGATTSEALVHPWGGRRAMLGTNPLLIAVPAAPAPLVLDMATSIVAMGKIHDYANRGEAIPLGWALDERGNPTSDAVAAKRGAIAPFGGAKGYALGVALEVLVTALSGAAIGTRVKGTLDSENVCNKGDLFVVISPHAGGAIEDVVSAYLSELREGEPAHPGEPVRIPGEHARLNRDRALAEGLPIDDDLWRSLQEMEALAA